MFSRRTFLQLAAAGLSGTGCHAGLGANRSVSVQRLAVPLSTPIVDVHCHIFSHRDVPIEAFTEQLGDGVLAAEIESIRLSDHEWDEWLASFMNGEVKPPFTRKCRQHSGGRIRCHKEPGEWRDVFEAAPLGKSPVTYGTHVTAFSRYAAASSLARDYPDVALFTPSLVDFDAWVVPTFDAARTSLFDRIRYHSQISRLSIQGRVPFGIADSRARVHPFTTYDPLREVRTADVVPAGPGYNPFRESGRANGLYDPSKAGPVPLSVDAPPSPKDEDEGKYTALDLLRFAVEQCGFIGVKLFPPIGFAPSGNRDHAAHFPHLAQDGLGAKLDRALLALFSYCESEEVPVMSHTSAEHTFGKSVRPLIDPKHWRPVLEQFPKLRLNLAHFGRAPNEDDALGADTRSWMATIVGLMKDYEFVYADLGNSPLITDPDYERRYAHLVAELHAGYPELKHRLLYGSDWWLSTLSRTWSHEAALVKSRDFFARVFGEGAVPDLMGMNALRYLGLHGPSTKNAERLRRFYGEQRPPSWLILNG